MGDRGFTGTLRGLCRRHAVATQPSAWAACRDRLATRANGFYNGAASGSASTGGAKATLTGLTVVTSGDQANGVTTANGGATTISGGSIKTTGLRSDAVYGDRPWHGLVWAARARDGNAAKRDATLSAG